MRPGNDTAPAFAHRLPPRRTPTPTPDLIAPVKAWADAINKGDVDAALALITEDSVVVWMLYVW